MTPSTSFLRPIPLLFAAALLVVGMVGCGPRERGVPSSARPESRHPSEGAQLGSQDLVVATDSMVESIAEELNRRFGEDEGPRVIVLDRVVNETSDRTQSFQIFLARVRSNLNQSGARENMTFVETRRRAEDILLREGVPATDAGRTRPDLALTGVFYDMPRGQTNFYYLTFQLMDMRDQTLIWEGDYEVKL